MTNKNLIKTIGGREMTNKNLIKTIGGREMTNKNLIKTIGLVGVGVTTLVGGALATPKIAQKTLDKKRNSLVSDIELLIKDIERLYIQRTNLCDNIDKYNKAAELSDKIINGLNVEETWCARMGSATLCENNMSLLKYIDDLKLIKSALVALTNKALKGEYALTLKDDKDNVEYSYTNTKNKIKNIHNEYTLYKILKEKYICIKNLYVDTLKLVDNRQTQLNKNINDITVLMIDLINNHELWDKVSADKENELIEISEQIDSLLTELKHGKDDTEESKEESESTIFTEDIEDGAEIADLVASRELEHHNIILDKED